LKEYWNFDLVSFIAGEVFSSIPLIFAMIRNLPEGSRFNATRLVDDENEPHEEFEMDPRNEALADNRVWTLDRRLQAMAINAIYTHIAVAGHWGKNGPPDFPTIGPSDWRAESTKSKEPKDNFDVLRKMGWPGG
jgi:hypothetical protein